MFRGVTGRLTNQRVWRFVLIGAHPQPVVFNTALERGGKLVHLLFKLKDYSSLVKRDLFKICENQCNCCAKYQKCKNATLNAKLLRYDDIFQR